VESATWPGGKPILVFTKLKNSVLPFPLDGCMDREVACNLSLLNLEDRYLNTPRIHQDKQTVQLLISAVQK